MNRVNDFKVVIYSCLNLSCRTRVAMTCKPLFFKEPHCNLVGMNNTLPYPQCCPHYDCAKDEHGKLKNDTKGFRMNQKDCNFTPPYGIKLYSTVPASKGRQVTSLHDIPFADNAWRSEAMATILNCFRHAGAAELEEDPTEPQCYLREANKYYKKGSYPHPTECAIFTCDVIVGSDGKKKAEYIAFTCPHKNKDINSLITIKKIYNYLQPHYNLTFEPDVEREFILFIVMQSTALGVPPVASLLRSQHETLLTAT
uniref:Uncharacterized protein n=1 Tax=Timema poppense TaxID=170557 RepID=A0A7R9CIK3_TIMPO|nr:unnamed protein product [Timema poppensis]